MRVVEKVAKKFDDTKATIETMVNRLTPGYAPPGSVSHIPLNPKAQDWASRIPFWNKGAWKALKKKSNGPIRLDSSVASAFLEDENGCAVSDDVLKAVYKDVRGFFADKYNNPETRGELGPREKVGLQTSEQFHILLEGKYPWLRLCDGHWKVNQLWTNVWSSWAANHQKARSTPTTDNDKKFSIGVKRRTTDDDEDITETPAKKTKKDQGKGVDRPQVSTSTTVPPSTTRPKPTMKTTAKLPTVSTSFSHPYHFHTHERYLEKSIVSTSSPP